MNSLIYAQIRQIKKSKFLLVELCISPLFLLFFSYNCNNSMFLSPEYMILIGLAVLAALSGEILHISTIDEMKNGTFDIILISPIRPIRIIMGKIFSPVTGILVIEFVSIILNNILSLKLGFHTININYRMILLVVTVALFSGFAELISLLFCRRQDKVIHAYLLMADMVFALGYIFLMDGKSNAFAIIFSMLILSFEMIIALYLLKTRYQIVKSKKILYSSIFNNHTSPQLVMFFKKNISALRLQNNVFCKMIVAFLLPIMGAFLCCYNENIPDEFVFALSITGLQTFFAVCLILYTCICENVNNIVDIFQIAGKKSGYGIFEKCVTVGLVTSIFALFDYIFIKLFLVDVSIVCILFTLLNNFIIAFVCAICCKNIREYKYAEQFKAFISVLCIVFQGIGLLLCDFI